MLQEEAKPQPGAVGPPPERTKDVTLTTDKPAAKKHKRTEEIRVVEKKECQPPIVSQLKKMEVRQQSANKSFGEYVALTLDNIADADVAAHAKLQIQILLSRATIEAAQMQLNKTMTPQPYSSSSSFCGDTEEAPTY